MLCTTGETGKLEELWAHQVAVTAPVLWLCHFMTRNGMGVGGLVYNK